MERACLDGNIAKIVPPGQSRKELYCKHCDCEYLSEDCAWGMSHRSRALADELRRKRGLQARIDANQKKGELCPLCGFPKVQTDSQMHRSCRTRVRNKMRHLGLTEDEAIQYLQEQGVPYPIELT